MSTSYGIDVMCLHDAEVFLDIFTRENWVMVMTINASDVDHSVINAKFFIRDANAAKA